MLKRNEWLISAVCFLVYLGISSWYPFYNLYLKDMGFSGTQIGIIAGLYQFTLFFVVPLWGMLSDHAGNRRVLQMVLAGSLILIFFVPAMRSFPVLLIYMFFIAVMHHPLGSLLDSLILEHLHGSQGSSFGAIRLFGSIGWAAGSAVMGAVLLKYNAKFIFPTASVLFLITLITASFIQYRPALKENTFSFKDMIPVFANRQTVVFLILLMMLGITASPLYVFINLYFRDIGADNGTVGLAFSLQALCELPFFFYGSHFIRRYGSHRVIILSISVMIGRMLLYSITGNPQAALLIGLFQGFTVSLFWVGIVDFLHNIVPSRWRATAQALIWAFHLGAGISMGNVLIGKLSDVMAMQQVMLLAACGTALVLVLFLLFFQKNKAESS